MKYYAPNRLSRRKSIGFSRHSSTKKNGFTLIELIVVIAIMLIVFGVVWYMINPLEISKEARDSSRLVDLYSLNQAVIEASEATNGSKTSVLCVGGLNSGLCQGQSNQGGRSLDGNGWVKANLTGAKQLSTLPVDPLNNGNYHYTYVSDGQNWELDTKLESDKYVNSLKKMSGDNGNNDQLFEIGTDLNLIP